MKKPVYIISLLLAVCLYFTYKLTGRGEFAVLALVSLIVAAAFRIIYDAVHHSFPWSKTTAQNDKETKGELARKDRILKEQRHKDMTKARKAGKLDEYLEQEAATEKERKEKYSAYQVSETETHYVSLKKDVPKSK